MKLTAWMSSAVNILKAWDGLIVAKWKKTVRTMEITIRINEFMGQTEDGRYKLRVDTEELRNIVAEHTQTTEQLFTTEYMAKHPKRIEAMLQSPQVRHLIWQKEELRRHAQEVLHEANRIAATARKQIQHDCRHLTTEELESLQSAAE